MASFFKIVSFIGYCEFDGFFLIEFGEGERVNEAERRFDCCRERTT